MSLYFRLFRTWLRANFKAPIQMGDSIVGGEGFVSSDDARRAMGPDPASPAFPASIRSWVETERLMSA